MRDWTDDNFSEWRRYKATIGMDTVGAAATEAGNAYRLGYEWAQSTLNPDVPKGGGSK